MPTGTVVAFDAHCGSGTVRGEGAEYPFHCTQIVDGSRHIDVGTTVTFEVVPGHLGRWEAAAITPADHPGGA